MVNNLDDCFQKVAKTTMFMFYGKISAEFSVYFLLVHCLAVFHLPVHSTAYHLVLPFLLL